MTDIPTDRVLSGMEFNQYIQIKRTSSKVLFLFYFIPHIKNFYTLKLTNDRVFIILCLYYLLHLRFCYLGADNRWNSFIFHTNKNMHIIDLEGLKFNKNSDQIYKTVKVAYYHYGQSKKKNNRQIPEKKSQCRRALSAMYYNSQIQC
jgi:hypothetical protein